MIELKLNDCALTIFPANYNLAEKLQLKVRKGNVEWQCPECNTKNQIKLKNLPYEFEGGDGWSRIRKSAAYIKQINRLGKRKSNLMSFLIERAKIKEKYFGENFQLKYSASTQIREQCTKCGTKITFNISLSLDSQLLPKRSEMLTLEKIDVEIRPEDDDKIIRRLFRGYEIYLLVKEYSLKICREIPKGIELSKDNLKTLQDLLGWISNLKGDIEKICSFDEIKEKAEGLLEIFNVKDSSMYVSNLVLFIEKMKISMLKSLRRKLFLSLAWLEEYIERMVLKQIK